MLKKLTVSIILIIGLFCLPLPRASAAELSEDSVTAPAAILMESSTGKILFEKNSHEQRAAASITKIMTMLLVCEAVNSGKISLEDTVTASAYAASMGGSDIWLEEGEAMSVHELLKATAVASANDAAVALAEYISGSEDAFVEAMNEKAAELGMNETVFKNCNGLDEDGHVTSAYDVAVMSRELMKHEMIFEYTSIWLDTLRDGKTQIVNTNKLLKTYSGITGLKTGTTDDAGCCISASAERDGLSLIAVALGCKTGTERFADAAALLDYGFSNYSVEELSRPEDLQTSVTVENGMQSETSISCEISGNIVLDKGEASDITVNVDLPESVEAPVEEGQKLGTVEYISNDEIIASFDITAADAVEKISFSAVLAVLFNSVFAL